jgi:hypothetical protein
MNLTIVTRRPWVPFRDTHPTCKPIINNWPALLMRLFPESTIDGMRVKDHATFRRFRSSYDPQTGIFFKISK